ncbi:MAG: SDR family oxidoreductase [Planctomycetes bacterium]|nr:SDR family oxidoreductase [Planctomycetota bacterium]
MSEDFSKKRVLITGCSSGFGMMTAIAAAGKGYDCIATMRNIDKAQTLKQALKRQGLTATIDLLDVTDQQAIIAIAEKYAPIDILINNAGILITGSFMDLTDAEARRVFETNYFGAVNLTKAVIPSMIERQQGRIINVASLAGLVGHMFNAAYSASKHALIGFSKSIQTELRPFNIKVVSVEPGYHRTEMIGANANVAENLYDPASPMYDYSRGFLYLMLKRIIPNAGDPQVVVDKIIDIMETPNPKLHYVLGKDARLITIAKRLGLLRLLEKEAYKKLLIATQREKKRAQSRRKKRRPD